MRIENVKGGDFRMASPMGPEPRLAYARQSKKPASISQPSVLTTGKIVVRI